jgi:HEAT repeat protein
MKSWRIHFAWAMVTGLAAVLSARIASRREALEAPAASRPPSVRAGQPAPTGSELQRVEVLPLSAAGPFSKSADPSPEPSLAGKIRALLKDFGKWEELQTLMNGLEDRKFKLGLLSEALAGPDMQAVNSAMILLSSMKGWDVAEILEAYLKSHLDNGQGANAASALGDIGDLGSLAVLQDALWSKNEEVRLFSAEALMRLGYPAPAEEMIAAMARQYESPDGSLRKKAIESISRLNAAGAVPVLARALKDSNGDVRRAALWGFSNLGKPEYLPLLEPLANDPHPEVAKDASDLIEALKNP